MAVPPVVLELIDRYERNRADYEQADYGETEVRREFIDPWFKALGWDIDNEQGLAEAYKDVVHEDTVKVGKATKAPDYGFRVGGLRKFFVEAKKPFENLKQDAGHVYQLRRYAWSGKLPLSVLSSFGETAVYDCRIRPKLTDKASVARVMYFTFDELPARWDEFAAIFSKEAVLKGSFDRYAESNKKKKGTGEVDAAFLADIEQWRYELARNLALRNPGLETRELNFAVQRIIDRIVFLRIAEDRGIEDYGSLQALLNMQGVYRKLGELFRAADDRYNSGIFHFEPEKGRTEPPDDLTLALDLDDKPLKEIIQGLYYPQSPYEFSVLSADILGQVYEQFLGKVITLTAGHRAVVEDKPEVKKAGGVYYTPTYIVDYIVEQTVGQLLAGKTPKQAAKLRVLDPACGSGSFLIGAYQHLLNWHLKWYAANGHKNEAYTDHRGNLRLTIAERKRILLNNIYGVDIDSQAVEVTKLSLLLKVLEGASREALERQRRLFHERALPDLGSNIKCGNSLIGPDFYDGEQLSLFDEDERFRINVFDWRGKDGFAEIMHSGGFDAVIGNPPYGAYLGEFEVDYLRQRFMTATRDLDTYSLFMERATELTSQDGRFSMIVPTGWYSGLKFRSLRKFIAVNSDPISFVNLPYDVFDAWVDTSVFVARKRKTQAVWPRTDVLSVSLRIFPKRFRITSSSEIDCLWQTAQFASWFAGGQDEYLTYSDTATTHIMRKMDEVGTPLGELADVQRGVTPFHVSASARYKSSRKAFTGTIRRYVHEAGDAGYIRFDSTLAEPKPERYFIGPRILLRELISRQFRLQAMRVDEDFVTNKSMQSILGKSDGIDINFLLAVLNSQLMSWYFLRRSNVAQRDDFPKIVLKETRLLPIAVPDRTTRDGKKFIERIANLVSQVLELGPQLAKARSDHAKTVLQRQIDATDRQIDQLVYQLYGLTDAEIAIVEGDSRAQGSPSTP